MSSRTATSCFSSSTHDQHALSGARRIEETSRNRLTLNYGTKAPRWFFLPLVLAHLQVFAYGQFGLYAWYASVVLFIASVAWLVWACRETLVAGLLFAFFVVVYATPPALLIYFS